MTYSVTATDERDGTTWADRTFTHIGDATAWAEGVLTAANLRGWSAIVTIQNLPATPAGSDPFGTLEIGLEDE